MKGEKPYLDRGDRLPKQQADFLMHGKMGGLYLGACLDSIRWGAPQTVMYEMPAAGLVSFIQEWFRQNSSDYQRLFHERQIEELFTRFELPHIHYEHCPRNKFHKGTITDIEGKVRCADHIGAGRKMRPSFIEQNDGYDQFSLMMKRDYFENEYMGYDEEKLFRKEEPSLLIDDPCYAVISDNDVILSLEKILARLNLHPKTERVFCMDDKFVGMMRTGCTPERVAEMSPEMKKWYNPDFPCPGHYVDSNKTEFSFDGWDMAYYVLKWHEQCTSPPWFDKE